MMPYKGEEKKRYEKRELTTFHLKVPKFLEAALREKLSKEGAGRTPTTFFVDCAAEFCGLSEKVAGRRSAKSIYTVLVSPDGQEYETGNLKAFCRNNLDIFGGGDLEIIYSCLSAARRREGSWRGWRFKK